ncbi:multiple antibiotic resistance protein [Gillisia sp. Hel1_33_143]|uniref:MarC family protein n=1 Tax=Gillisia sp. Hel1_33_143 TaxID=1336796 RepID=UPI00087A5903|nr:MarC family protein [Gillisia sp. Hel1_33_143]SDS20632.1 multiple antibiotic resistance protein [Gillisia sp. Hel1_33_143]
MENLWLFAIAVFTGFFAINSPAGNIPIFISLTKQADRATKKKISKKATITAFIIVTGFIILGKYIFDLFGLTIPAFKITGGILIFFVGFEMIRSQESSIDNQTEVNFNEGISISPLAIPILAGPGTIVTAMNYTTTAGYIELVIIISMLALIMWLNYLAFISSEYLVKYIGANKIVVIEKIMGLIIAIIGTNMFIQGVKLAFFTEDVLI